MKSINIRSSRRKNLWSKDTFEIIEFRDKKEKRTKNSKESLRELWNIIKKSNVQIIRVPEGEQKEEVAEGIYKEIMPESSNFGRNFVIQVHEAHRSPNIFNLKRSSPRYIIIGASLVAQWLRICLLMQGTRVRALVWEDPTCQGATGPVSHNY